MDTITDLKGLFVEQLRDRYDAARQQADMYPKLLEASTHPGLQKIITEDIDANKDHLEKLDAVFAKLGENPGGEECEGTKGLIYEANELLEYAGTDVVLNAGIAVSVQHINHHDIAGYSSCILYANATGEKEMAETLNAMLDDEKTTHEALNTLALELIEGSVVTS